VITADNVFLIGPMGAGKSTIGKALARALGKAFHDTDKAIEARTGASVNLIFDIEGEDGFRRRECEMLDELTGLHGIVLATGGGVVLREENRQHLRTRGFVIYLEVPLPQLLDRTRLDKSRPLLRDADPETKLRLIVAQRDPLYRETADLILETGNRTVAQVVRILQTKIPQ
jgi:shikimate kinase